MSSISRTSRPPSNLTQATTDFNAGLQDIGVSRSQHCHVLLQLPGPGPTCWATPALPAAPGPSPLPCGGLSLAPGRQDGARAPGGAQSGDTHLSQRPEPWAKALSERPPEDPGEDSSAAGRGAGFRFQPPQSGLWWGLPAPRYSRPAPHSRRSRRPGRDHPLWRQPAPGRPHTAPAPPPRRPSLFPSGQGRGKGGGRGTSSHRAPPALGAPPGAGRAAGTGRERSPACPTPPALPPDCPQRHPST